MCQILERFGVCGSNLRRRTDHIARQRVVHSHQNTRSTKPGCRGRHLWLYVHFVSATIIGEITERNRRKLAFESIVRPGHIHNVLHALCNSSVPARESWRATSMLTCRSRRRCSLAAVIKSTVVPVPWARIGGMIWDICRQWDGVTVTNSPPKILLSIVCRIFTRPSCTSIHSSLFTDATNGFLKFLNSRAIRLLIMSPVVKVPSSVLNIFELNNPHSRITGIQHA